MTETRSFPYSSRTRTVLAIARSIAAGRGDTDVTPVHIAIGLVREGENAALAILLHQGVPLDALRHELERLLGPPPGGTKPEEVVRPLTPGEQRVLEQARIWSQREGDEHIGAQHLLLAILAEGESPAAQALVRHGISAETATASMRVVILKHPHSPSAGAAPRAV